MSGARRVLRRALSFPVVIVTMSALGACGDANNFLSPAIYDNVDRQYGVYAITGSPIGLPAGYQFTTESIVRPQVLGNGTINFDVAFDITTGGQALVMSARRVVPAPPTAIAPVGFLRPTAVYDQLVRAPDKGFTEDTLATLSVGESLVIRLSGSSCIYGEPYYAKLTIDSINVAERRLLVRSLVNRNCGYRSLSAGIPKD